MNYAQPHGVADANAGYVDGNPALGIEGSAVPAKAIENPQRELVHLIIKAGLTPDDAKLTQVYEAIQALILKAMPEIPERYEVGQYYPFQDEMPRPGMIPLLGLWVEDFSRYTKAVEYFETSYGHKRLVSLDEYNARHVAFWHTCADGTKIGWDGEGGVNVFVWDKQADRLLVPDLAGMSWQQTCAALGVGEGRGDQGRNATGMFEIGNPTYFAPIRTVDGALDSESATAPFIQPSVGSALGGCRVRLDLSRVVPTGPVFAPKRWGALACCYLGVPK